LQNRKPKILFVFRGLGIGGAEKILVFVANVCVEAGYDVSILSLSDKEQTLKTNSEIKIHFINYDSVQVNKSLFVKKGYQKLQLLYKLRKKIHKLKPDIIVTFMSDLVRIVHLSSTGLQIPIIGSERGNPLGYSKKQYIKYSNAYRKCNAVVFQTEKAADVFDVNIRKKSYIIPNPCIPRLNHIKPYEGVRRPIIFSAGRLETQKRFDILILSFREVLKKHPGYQLFIYGEGTQREYLQKMIEEMNLGENILLKGDVRDVFAEARDCTAFVLSSDYEGIPNVLIEALSIGIPCISTDCDPGGPRLLMDNGRRGNLVRVGDIGRIANSICAYIENPELANQFGALGMEIIEELAPDVIAQKWLDLIATIR
jgi:GalNAc-alpha-(1->4)-GalNAc-alpha-(1->3)-diNAcBac-PP-undecaprenol alpha-1,4-N-acetyl-D-galactosaminyltransferase